MTQPEDASLRHTADFHRGRKSLHLELANTSRDAWIEDGDTKDLVNAEWHESQAAREEDAIQRALGIVIDEGSSVDCLLEKHGDCKQGEDCTCHCHTSEIRDTAVKAEA